MPDASDRQPQRLMGIDPGSRTIGLCVLDYRRGQAECVALQSHALGHHGGFAARMAGLYAEVRRWVDTYQPEVCAIEQIFMYRSPESSLKLAQARGVALAAVAAGGLEVYEYMPASVKQAVVGTGRADKLQVAHMIQRLLKLPEQPSADGADAAAVALCHAYRASALGGLSAQGDNEQLKLAAQSRYRRRSGKKGWRSVDPATLKKPPVGGGAG